MRNSVFIFPKNERFLNFLKRILNNKQNDLLNVDSIIKGEGKYREGHY